MEVNVVVDVKPDEFFNALIKGVIADIGQTTGKRIRPAHILKGYTYTKSYKTGDAKIRIHSLKENEEYHSEYIFGDTKVNMSYYISQEDGGALIRYEEVMTGGKQSFFNKMAGLRASSKTKKLIKNIANLAYEDRKETEVEEENE